MGGRGGAGVRLRVFIHDKTIAQTNTHRLFKCCSVSLQTDTSNFRRVGSPDLVRSGRQWTALSADNASESEAGGWTRPSSGGLNTCLLVMHGGKESCWSLSQHILQTGGGSICVFFTLIPQHLDY